MSISIDLIKKEIQAGVTDVFVTPHYIKIRNYLSDYASNLAIFKELQAEVEKADLKVNLYLGNEIYATSTLLKDLKDQRTTTLGDSKMVLVEFSLTEPDYEIAEAINDLVSMDYIPVIAHPERYPYINNIHDFKIMKKMGALIQVNAESVCGVYGKKIRKFVFQCLKEDLVDFIASDIHNFRKNRLAEAYETVKRKFSPELADKIFNNRSILEINR